MSEDKEYLNHRKKFLYLDKFEKYKEDRNVWGLSINERLKNLSNRIDGLLWIPAVSLIISVIALLVAVLK